ncbi:hypothetical protein Tco_1206786 [Tanacetum coccineum]
MNLNQFGICCAKERERDNFIKLILDGCSCSSWFFTSINVLFTVALAYLEGLIDLPFDGYAYTWAHETTNKMNFLHSWFNLNGIDKMVEDTWKSLATVDSNGEDLHSKLFDIDKILDQGGSNEEILSDRSLLLKELNYINSIDSLEAAQKSKVCWAIEGYENTKFFHGILNSKNSQLAIRRTLVDGEWIVNSLAVKSVFLKYFSTNFSSPVSPHICFADQFTNRLSLEQQAALERNVFNEEIKSVVWDCRTNKSPGLFSDILIDNCLTLSHLFFADDANGTP